LSRLAQALKNQLSLIRAATITAGLLNSPALVGSTSTVDVIQSFVPESDVLLAHNIEKNHAMPSTSNPNDDPKRNIDGLKLSTKLSAYTIPIHAIAIADTTMEIRLPPDGELQEAASHCIRELSAEARPKRNLETIENELLSCLRIHGHPYGKLQGLPPVKGHPALLIKPGPVMRIKRIRTADPEVRVPETRLWTIYGTDPGALFDADRVLRFKDALEKNQLLTGISIQARPIDQETLELVIEGTPAGKNVIAAGVDYSADGLGITGRWVHGGPDWLAGKIDSAIRYRPQKNELFARMRIPFSETVEHSIRSDLYAENRKHPAYTVNNSAAMLRMSKPLTEKGLGNQAARYTLGIGLQTGHENALNSAAPDRPTDAFLSEFSVSGTEYFIPLRTHLTMNASTLAKWSNSGENTDRLSTTVRIVSETPIPRRWTYTMRLQVSTLHHRGDAEPLLSDRLYLGGASDMRGYKLSAIGSTIGVGQSPGGVASWVLAPQLLRDVTTPWGVVQMGPFIDFGGLSQTHDLSGPIYRSAGLAARAKTSLGESRCQHRTACRWQRWRAQDLRHSGPSHFSDKVHRYFKQVTTQAAYISTLHQAVTGTIFRTDKDNHLSGLLR